MAHVCTSAARRLYHDSDENDATVIPQDLGTAAISKRKKITLANVRQQTFPHMSSHAVELVGSKPLVRQQPCLTRPMPWAGGHEKRQAI